MIDNEIQAPSASRFSKYHERQEIGSALRGKHGQHVMEVVTRTTGAPIGLARVACHEGWTRVIEDPEIDLTRPFLPLAQVTQLAVQTALRFKG